MGALSSLATVGLNLALADQARRRRDRDINAERDEDIQKIQQRDAEAQRRAADRLRRELATQRARAGAAGIGGSASSAAILEGLTQEAAFIEQAQRVQSGQAIEAINRDARNARRANLLELGRTTTRSSLSRLNGGQSRSLLDR